LTPDFGSGYTFKIKTKETRHEEDFLDFHDIGDRVRVSFADQCGRSPDRRQL